MTIRSDNPISKSSDDALGRYPQAQAFVSQVMALDAAQGLVVGVLGRWGSGKTSFINFARDGFGERTSAILDFNPWMFSGAEQLVDSFFIELSAQLRLKNDKRLAAIASALADYGEVFSGLGWLPVAGPWIERSRKFAKSLGKLLEKRNEGVGERKHALERALRELDHPVVVVLDDIDRLATDEIRDIFKLVRLTASFPNVIYVLAFDRFRIEEALSEQGISGRDYLEKIIQVTVDLPMPPRKEIAKQLLKSIDEVLKELDHEGPFDNDLWPDILAEVVLPLVQTMRDVRRYVAALHGTLLSLNEQIALQDVLALEAVRVFLPDVFDELTRAAGALTKTADLGYRSDSAAEKAQVEALVEHAGEYAPVVSDLIRRVFPAAGRFVGGSSYGSDFVKSWLAGRRMATEDVLRLYLERVQGEDLQAFANAERLFAVLADRGVLESSIAEIDASEREPAIRMLESFEQDFKPEHVVPGCVVLLNEWPRLPERSRPMFDFGTRLAVGRVVYRLIRSLKDPSLIEAAVREGLPQIETLGAQFELITHVGYRENAGHKLVTEEAADRLEQEWAERVQSAPTEALLNEPDVGRTLHWARDLKDKSGSKLEVDADPRITLQVLRSVRTYAQSQSLESRAVRRSLRLGWVVLESLYGSEEAIKQRIEAIDRSDLVDEDQETLELADRYLGGWRPPEFGDDDNDE